MGVWFQTLPPPWMRNSAKCGSTPEAHTITYLEPVEASPGSHQAGNLLLCWSLRASEWPPEATSSWLLKTGSCLLWVILRPMEANRVGHQPGMTQERPQEAPCNCGEPPEAPIYVVKLVDMELQIWRIHCTYIFDWNVSIVYV